MVPEYNIREEISPEYLSYWYQNYQQNLPDYLWYILIYIPVLMRYLWRCYFLNTYWYTCRMIIMRNSYNYCYKVIWYMHNKMIYSNIYPSTYTLRVQVLLPKCILVRIREKKYDLILLSYASTQYTT